MMNLFDVDYVRTERMVREFVDHTGLRGETQFVCIYRSANFARERQVFKVGVGDATFAMKVDLEGAKSNRLVDEFALLQKLHRHFTAYEKQKTPEPVYLSKNGDFFVVEYIDSHTASDAIKTTKNPRSVGQAYRRAGGWLHALHEFRPLTQRKIYPNWMFKTLDASLETGPQAPRDTLERWVEAFRKDVAPIEERHDTRAYCHGDFHAGNLILSQGVTYGFDLTEAHEKPALYDIVDFLKVDIFREGLDADVDHSGVTQQAKEMFFKLYRHPIDRELLDICLKGRILMDWAFITPERYTKSEFQRNKYRLLERRLEIAFGEE